MAEMITSSRAGPIDKSVLLYSGGMDSVCFAHLLRPDVLLYVPTGAAYEAVETAKLNAMVNLGYVPQDRLCALPGVLNLAEYERDDAIVPNRNAHLMLLASHYGDRIILCSVSGDRSTDKDPDFYLHMARLLEHMWQEQHWTAARYFTIASPFKHLTKTALVARYLAERGDPAALLASYSCYSGAEQACGVCKPCARKWVALANNGIATDIYGYFQAKFWETDWFAALLPAMIAGAYRGDEDADFVRFLRDRRVV